jgi:HEAT repeat protein
VRLAAVRALARIPVGASPYLLEERTSDEDPVVASAAREALVPAPTEADRALAGPPCPSTPSDVVALRALLSDRAASVHERALAAVALARSPDPDAVSALAPVTDRWPRLVRAAALLARDRAGHVVRPDDVALERRAFDVARQAHPALVRALDACVEAALRAPVPPDGAHRTSAPAP